MCTNCNSANIDLGGLGGELLPIDLDGYDIVGGLQTIYALNVTPSALMGNITVEKGPGDFAAPGEAIGGAIHLSSAARGGRPLFQAAGELGSYGWASGQANATYNARGFSGTALYVRSHSQEVDANGDGYPESGRLYRRYGLGEVSYRFANGLQLTAGASTTDEDDYDGHGKYSLVASFIADPSCFSDPTGCEAIYLREDAYVEQNLQRLGMDLPVAERGKLTLRAMHSGREQSILDQNTFPDDPVELTYQIDDRNFSGEIRYEHLIGNRVLLAGGVTRRRQVLDVDNELAVLLTQAHTTDIFENSGADAGVEIDINPQWHLRAGLRYDEWGTSHVEGEPDPDDPGAIPTDKLVQSKSWSQVSPRARLTWKPARAWTFALAAGRASRAARPVFEEVCCGQQYQSNIELELERSYAGSLEAVWQPEPWFRLGAYGHRTVFRDHILRMVGSSLGGVQTYVQGNVPRAEYTGLTLTSRMQVPERLTVDLSYSWLDAKNTSDSPISILFFPPSSPILTLHNIPMDDLPYRAHRAGSAQVLWTEPQSRFDVTLGTQYQGEMLIQNWNPGVIGIEPSPQYGLLYDLEETPSFWIVNARVSWRPQPKLDLHLGVDNIGDYVQADLSDPSNDYNWGPIRGRYYYGGVTFTLD